GADRVASTGLHLHPPMRRRSPPAQPMKPTKTMLPSRFAVTLPLLAGGALSSVGLAGCAVSGPNDPEGTAAALPLPEGAGVVGEFMLRVSPREGKMDIRRIERRGPALTPESQSDVNIIGDGVAGSGPPNTVELVTNSIGYDGMCPAQTSNSV